MYGHKGESYILVSEEIRDLHGLKGESYIMVSEDIRDIHNPHMGIKGRNNVNK